MIRWRNRPSLFVAICMIVRESLSKILIVIAYADMFRYFHKATGMTAEVQGRIAMEVQKVRERLDGLKRR